MSKMAGPSARSLDFTDLDDDHDELGEVLAEAAQRRPSFTAAYEDARARQLLLCRLMKLRKVLSITQKQVAERMQTTQSSVSDLENGVVDPHLSTLQRYARAVTARLLVEIDLPHDSPWCDVRFYTRSPDGTRLNAGRPLSPPSPGIRRWRSLAGAGPIAHQEESTTRLAGAR